MPRVTDNEPNKINWEPIKTNIGCCELYLLAKKRESFICSSPSFGGGSSLGGIIYCFPAVITYSSYYLVELWRHIKSPSAGRERENKGGKIDKGRKNVEEHWEEIYSYLYMIFLKRIYYYSVSNPNFDSHNEPRRSS